MCPSLVQRIQMLIKFAIAITVGLFTANGSASARVSTRPLVSPSILAKASRVAVCEEGGWSNANGPRYFGALGWLSATWDQYRAPSFPASAATATPEQQAWAMAHFVGSVEHGWWPDQTGCTGGY